MAGIRALIYNKGAWSCTSAALIGDEIFTAIRRFYTEWRFRKAGTDACVIVESVAGGHDSRLLHPLSPVLRSRAAIHAPNRGASAVAAIRHRRE